MDAPVTDRTLRQYLARALDPGRREEVEDALAQSRTLRDRLALLRATTVADEPSAWRVPPLGLAGPWGLHAGLSAGAAMGEDAPGVGDYLELRFDVPPGLGHHRLVVIERGSDAEWTVLYPTCAAEERAARLLPRDATGRASVDVVVGEVGPQRLAVALIPDDVPVAWDRDGAARWAEVQAAIAAGRAPVQAVSLGAASGDLRTRTTG